MPSPFHDHAVDLVESMLMCILARTARRLRSNGGVKVATELERVYKGRSASVELKAIEGMGRVRKSSKVDKRKDKIKKKDTLTRHPDSSFYHPAQPHLPSTVVEVAFSQGRRKLWKLAQSYIHHANVKCVIALELPYRKRSDKSIGSAAAISVWRPRSVECHPIDLRGGGIYVSKHASLDLYPSDFLPSDVLSASSCAPVVAMELPLAPLASVLSIAKSRMNTSELLQIYSPANFVIDIAMLERTRASKKGFDRNSTAGADCDWKSLSWWFKSCA